MGLLKTLTINGTTYEVVPVVPADSITLLEKSWAGSGTSYSQVVEVPGVTPCTKVDLQPTKEQLEEFHYKTLAFVTENHDGVITVYSIGDKPANDYTIQITKTEVNATGPVRGNTVGTTTPNPDWNQEDPGQADYIANKPSVPNPIVCAASGEVIAVGDASNAPLPGLTLYGNTTQNGTPTPESPVALESVGADGSIGVTVAVKNLWDEETVSGYWQSSNGTFVADSRQLASKNMIPVCSTIYTMSSSSAMEFRFYDKNKNYISGTAVWSQPATVEPPANACYMHINLKSGYGTEYKNDVCISAVPTAYDPYKPIQTLTVSTPNGLNGIGQYRDYIDFQRGVYVQQVRQIVMDGSVDEDWNCTADGRGYASCTRSTIKLGNAGGTVGPVMCAELPATTSRLLEQNTDKPGIVVRDYGDINIRIPGIESTKEAVRAYLSSNPITVRYALETPIETPLTEEQLSAFKALHTNKPTTTIINDGGAEMAVAYVADTKLYIDNKFAELATAIVNNA